jgi:hypothetical protein
MTEAEAVAAVQARFERDYAFVLVTPAERAGYVAREVARMLGQDVPRAPERTAWSLRGTGAPVGSDSLEDLLRASLSRPT